MNAMDTIKFVCHLQLIEKATKELLNEPESKPREQFDEEIDMIKDLLEHTKSFRAGLNAEVSSIKTAPFSSFQG